VSELVNIRIGVTYRDCLTVSFCEDGASGIASYIAYIVDSPLPLSATQRGV